MELKVGDRVKIKINLNRIDNFKCGYMSDMKKWEGENVTIKEVEGDYVKIIEHPFNWDKRAFEPIYSMLTKQELLKMPMGTKITTSKGEIFVKDNITQDACRYFENSDQYINGRNIGNELELLEHLEGDCIVKVETPNYSTVWERQEIKEMTLKEIEEKLGYKIKIKGE